MHIVDETELREGIETKLVEMGVPPADAEAHVDAVMNAVDCAFVSAMATLEYNIERLSKPQRMPGMDLGLQLLLGRLGGAAEDMRARLGPSAKYTTLDLGGFNND